MRGPFFDLNCALAFVDMNKDLLPEKTFHFICDYLIKRAREAGVADFIKAPPLDWLTDPECTRAVFVNCYKGPRVVGPPDLKAEHEKVIALATKRDRQIRQNARRKEKKKRSADDAELEPNEVKRDVSADE